MTVSDTYCGTRVWVVTAAYWTGKYWDYDGVYAWANALPDPYVPSDDERERMYEQVIKNNELANAIEYSVESEQFPF